LEALAKTVSRKNLRSGFCNHLKKRQGVDARLLDLRDFPMPFYQSLSEVAFAVTGTRWSGPRFFGLRDKPSSGARP
jgi:Protein of unknown function (DUF2924)